MKIAVIGGAGVRTPLLAAGLAGSDLPLERISLYDPDQERLGLIAPLADRLVSESQLLDSELMVPLALVFCRVCSLAQLRETVPPERLFDAEYPYYSSKLKLLRVQSFYYCKPLN